MHVQTSISGILKGELEHLMTTQTFRFIFCTLFLMISRCQLTCDATRNAVIYGRLMHYIKYFEALYNMSYNLWNDVKPSIKTQGYIFQARPVF